MATDQKSASTAIQAAQPYLEMDVRDEKQILAEMKGDYVESFVYQYQQGGRTISNLSYVGIKEAIRKRGNFKIEDYRIEETTDKYRAIIKVHDIINNIDVLGVAESEKSKAFAYVLAVNKAERNAFAKLIPAKFFADLIAEKLNGTERQHSEVIDVTPESSIPKPSVANNTSPPPVAESKIKPITEAPQVDWHTVTFELPMEGLKQIVLKDGEKTIGMMNVYSPNKEPEEVTLVPTEALKIEKTAISNFLFAKCLDSMIGVSYTAYAKADQTLAYIHIKGKFTTKQLKDINNGAQWAFAKALSTV